ncbi:FAD-dependent monooxygenase [Krasilnikovia sp. M28-CT-15]
MKKNVLIVGAGPVGMVLACELLQQGVSVRLIERNAAPPQDDPHSRAILLVPRALEQLRRIGVSEQLVAAGHKVPRIGYHSRGRLRGTAAFDRLPDTPYPFLLALPQKQTERVLRQRLAGLGGVIERGTAMESLDAADGPPTVVLRHADGRSETVRPDWLVGADGAASTTRKLLGQRLDGDDTDVTYVIADAPLSGPLPDGAHYCYSANGLVAIIPMRDGLYRIAGNVPHRTDDSAPPWQQILQDLVDQRVGLPLKVGPPTYARLVRPRCGRAQQFRVGQVFLIGDAAHVITPAGGQGMNLGIQDAVNLGWRLGGVATGRLDESVLDGYHRERSLAVARMSANTARLVALSLQRDRARAAVRDLTFRVLDRLGLVQRSLTPLLSQLDGDYAPGDGTPARWRRRPLHVGQRVPLFAPADADRPTSLDRCVPTVVLWPGRRPPRDWGAVSDDMRRRVAGRSRVLDLADLSPAERARLRPVFGRRPVAAVVRPDGHVAHLSGPDDPASVLRHLDAVLTTDAPEPAGATWQWIGDPAAAGPAPVRAA